MYFATVCAVGWRQERVSRDPWEIMPGPVDYHVGLEAGLS